MGLPERSVGYRPRRGRRAPLYSGDRSSSTASSHASGSPVSAARSPRASRAAATASSVGSTPASRRSAREILRDNSIEYPDGEGGEEVEYVLPGEKKSLWVGLVFVLALMVPWYAPESWNAQAVLGLPIWVWVILGALVLETLFIFSGTVIWRKRPMGGIEEAVETTRNVERGD